jgi:hypothetical protein
MGTTVSIYSNNNGTTTICAFMGLTSYLLVLIFETNGITYGYTCNCAACDRDIGRVRFYIDDNTVEGIIEIYGQWGITTITE